MDCGLKNFGSRKGFLLTVSVLLIVVFSVLLAQQFAGKTQSLAKAGLEMQPLERASYTAELLSFEAAKIAGTSASVIQSEDSTVLEISGSFPCGKSLQELANFRQIIEGSFAESQNLEVSADFSSILDGKSEISFSNGLNFECSYEEPSQGIEVYSVNESSIPSKISIIMDSNASLNDVNAWQWNPSGDLEVEIDYTDSSMTVKASGKISSEGQSVYSFNYPEGSMRIIAGTVDGRKGALRIEKDSGLSFESGLLLKAFLPPQGSFTGSFGPEIKVQSNGIEKSSALRPLGS